jgi:hypothetical protein
MPRESLDAPEDLSEQAPCQVALGELEDEVPGMPDEAPAGLEQPLLQARQRPALNGEGQDQSAQEIAEVVGDMCPSSLCGRPPRMSSNRKEFVLPMAT